MKLNEDRVRHDKNYRQDGIEVVMLKSALTITEWNEILQNQKLRELVDERIKILSRSNAPDSRVVKVVLNAFEKLLEDCKKWKECFLKS